MSGLTAADLQSGILYAQNRMLSHICQHNADGLCQNTTLTDAICANKTKCLTLSRKSGYTRWQQLTLDGDAIYADSNLQIEVIDQASCMALSRYPYDGCTFVKPVNDQNLYYEWNTLAGLCDMNKPCRHDEDCKGADVKYNNICIGATSTKSGLCKVSASGQSCANNMTCVRGRCTGCRDSMDCPGDSQCVTENGTKTCSLGNQCVYGNAALRNYCTSPLCRCFTNTQKCLKAVRKADSADPIPGWFYTEKSGECVITEEYCKSFGHNFLPSSNLKKDLECEVNNKTWEPPKALAGEGYECYQSWFPIDKPIVRPVCQTDEDCELYSKVMGGRYFCAPGDGGKKVCASSSSSCQKPSKVLSFFEDVTVGKSFFPLFFPDEASYRKRCADGAKNQL